MSKKSNPVRHHIEDTIVPHRGYIEMKKVNKFVDENAIHPDNSPVISVRSKKVIAWLYDKIVDAGDRFETLNSSSPGISAVNIPITSVYVDLGKSYRFINKEIRAEIDGTLKIKRVCKFSVGTRKVVLAVVFPEPRHISATEKEFSDILYKVYIWLCVAGELSDSACSANLKIFIVMSDLKKVLPRVSSPRILSEMNVNTAQTMSCRPTNEIHIYRREEWFKVLIHETMHALGMDFSGASDSHMTMANKRLKKTFPFANPDLRIYESYCEVWAEIINTLFCVYLSPRTSTVVDSGTNAMREIETRIRNEQTWSLFQCAKVISFYGIKYNDLYSHNTETMMDVNSRYLETNTTTFSYYVAKTILLYHIGEFLEWCAANNRNVVAFRETGTNIASFCDFITYRCRDPTMISHIQRFDGIVKGGRRHSEVMRTMRMSLNEN